MIDDVGHFKSESNVAEKFTDAFRNTLVAQYNYEFPLWTKSSLDKKIDDKTFLDYCLNKGLTTLKGHRSVGGFRASIYNAMPEDGVDALIEVMQDFEKNY